ncbi:MAG: hypothetical protein RJQ08_13525 [Salinisphaeraceae bacterium]
MKETSLHYDRVREFMRLAGQAAPRKPMPMPLETRQLRARLLLEEALETIQHGLGLRVRVAPGTIMESTLDEVEQCAFDEMHGGDLVELLDGCCDVSVVNTGTLIAAGLRDVIPQKLVDDNNLAKFGAGSHKRVDGKWVKPPSHQPPPLAEELARQIDHPYPRREIVHG